MAIPTKVILAVVENSYICGGANIVFDDYDFIWKSFVMKRNITNLMQRVFADSGFGPTMRHRFSVVLVQGEGTSSWFAQNPFSFPCESARTRSLRRRV